MVTLAGCATTQDEAARLQLNSARIRTAEQKTVVRSAGSAVEVSDVSMLSSPGAHTFVVTVHNRRASAVTDLPISVGVSSRGHRRVDLNAHSTQELSYFDAHLPRIAAGSSLTWVFTTTAQAARHERARSRCVGARARHLPPSRGDCPDDRRARDRAPRVRTHDGAVLEVTLRNSSTIPQYQMPDLRGRAARSAGSWPPAS